MTRKDLFPLIFMIGISIIPVLSIHIPRSLSFLPLVFGLGMSIWWVFIKKEKLVHSKPYMYSVLGVCALCIISSLWSLEPMDSYKQALKISAILIFSIPLFNLAQSIKVEILKPYLWLFPAGVSVAAALCAVELAFDLPLYQMTHDKRYLELSTAVMNRGVVSTIFAYFIALLFIDKMKTTQKAKKLFIVLMSISVIEMLLVTQSQSGQLAFAVGVIMFLLFPHRLKYSHAALAFMIISALALAPFIVNILFDLLMENAQELPWLKDAYAGNRVEIWDFVMRYAMTNPLYGYGMEATRYVPEFEHGYVYHKGPTILHPHNFAIQLWIEFGVIGIIAAGCFIAYILRKIATLDIAAQKSVTAVFIAVITVSAIGYGMWQSWWIGELVFLAALSGVMAKRQS